MPVLEAPWAEVRALVGLARAESVGEVEVSRPGRARPGGVERFKLRPGRGRGPVTARLDSDGDGPVRSASFVRAGRVPVRLATLSALTSTAGGPAAGVGN